MLIIPAIDIRQGNCVMLTQGKIEQETVFSNDPSFIAKLWKTKGAKRIHVVDLDGAFSGSPKNLEVIKDIRSKVDVPVQVGGGIRSLETIDNIINLGIDYVILGTVAVYNPDVLKKAVEKYKEKIIVALDGKDGLALIGGWKETTTVNIVDLAKKIESEGVKQVIYTDVLKDGMLSGPNIEMIETLLKSTKMNVIASGGMSTMDDVHNLKKLKYNNLFGVIIGKALFTDGIKLEEAIKTGSSN